MPMLPVFLKISGVGVVGTCLAITLCLFSAAACGRTVRTGVESASVALILLNDVQQDIGMSNSMEAIWISSEKQWRDIIAAIPKIELMEIPTQPVVVPDVDFARYGVLLIRIGEKPNGGYGLTLTADEATIENREARIPVRLSEPEPGFLYTQAIVYPHLVIKMEKGAFDGIAVVDQNGSVKMRLSVF